MKKVISALIIMVIVTSIAIFLINIYTTTYGHFKYKIINEQVYITKYDGATVNNLKIPSYIKDKPVTKIESGVFYGCEGLTGELVIPETVTIIESEAFKSCSNLSSIKMLGYAPSIQDNSFDEDIVVKYRYNMRGYDDISWEKVNTMPYDIPISEVEVEKI